MVPVRDRVLEGRIEMRRFIVEYESRESGAIGSFSWSSYFVKALTLREAQERIFDRFHEAGFETRGSRIQEVAQ